ncbi:MAG: efflux RND transporter periplasmic adaptor subunit [Synechococcales cyanobacterium T60_A2020_003]|nr:efflux RND transporter periplasmic adaptor subunit [Synechococcales cyanobacterium T60_A2020_003]
MNENLNLNDVQLQEPLSVPTPAYDSVPFEDERMAPPTQGWRIPSGLWLGLGMGLVIGAGAVGILLSGKGEPATAEPTQPTEQAVAQTVTAATVESAAVNRTLQTTGTVMASDLLPITPRASGLQIRQVMVDEGDSVTAGQVLAVLDDSVVRSQIAEAEASLESARAMVQQRQSAYAQAEATLQEAEANLQRYDTLSQEGVVSRQEYDSRATATTTARESVQVAAADIRSAEAQVRSAEARLQQLQTQLEQTLVIAPADGIVAERNARVGDVSSSSAPLFSIIRDRLLELQVKVPETQLSQIPVGAGVEISSDADSRIQLQGRVREIAPLVDSQTREATVKIELPSSSLLRAGMFLQANIVTSSASGLVVPAQAVLPQPDGTMRVYRIMEGDRVEAVTVEVGEIMNPNLDRQSATMEILSGLNAGDRVVVSGAGYLNDGDRVAIAN